MSRLVFSRFANYLDEIARQGSIRKAAETLNISASAIDVPRVESISSTLGWNGE